MPEQNYSANNKRIAKNTLLLYVRMLVTTVIALYTSRVILQTLGVEDFGIYNVVGGIIAMFSFINEAMTTATQRFLTFELGKDNLSRLKLVFTTSVQIHLGIALLILLLGETVGLWFVVHKLVIPEGRMEAAQIVYQFTVAAAITTILMVPFNAIIIAHERMSAFAYITVVEAVSKLLIVFSLAWTPYDKLVTYGLLLLLVQIGLTCVYYIYCRKHFDESRLIRVFDRSLMKEMSGFAGWSFLGNLAIILYSQGLNTMLNIFFGPVVNAARGLSVQVQGTTQKLVGSFQMALNPQITKDYASGQLEAMYTLVYRSARFSFFLMYSIAFILICECDQILHLWLETVPENTTIFCQLMMATTLLYTIVNPCAVANQASGKVRHYQITVSSILLLILPVSYLFLQLGFPPYIVFVVHITTELCAQVARMFLLRRNIDLPIADFCKKVYVPILVVMAVATPLPLLLHYCMEEGILRLLVVAITSVFMVMTAVYLFGIDKGERTYLVNVIRKIAKIDRE